MNLLVVFVFIVMDKITLMWYNLFDLNVCVFVPTDLKHKHQQQHLKHAIERHSLNGIKMLAASLDLVTKQN